MVSGSGISALALDSGFSKVFSSFRVEPGRGRGSDFSPKRACSVTVERCSSGKAGEPKRGRFFARFMNEDQTWLSGDVRVSKQHESVQVECLGGLHWPTTTWSWFWASHNQVSSNSMADVLRANCSPPPEPKIGSEFLINQYNTYNQRNPVVVGAQGRVVFAVAWVSEQQRVVISTPSTEAGLAVNRYPSVDIFARLYGQTAGAGGN